MSEVRGGLGSKVERAAREAREAKKEEGKSQTLS